MKSWGTQVETVDLHQTLSRRFTAWPSSKNND
jgi:hypothetical protein